MPRSTRLEDKYINTTSGLTATNYQGAIDELKNLIDSIDQTNNLEEIIVPANTEPGGVVFYDGTNLNTTTSLLLDQNFCSVGTIDDRGYDWCNWQIGSNGSAFTSSKKSLGTKANPTAITDGTKIGGWGFIGDDGIAPNVGSPGYVGAEISAFAMGAQSATNGGTRLQIEVTPENSKERQVILGTNNVGDIFFPRYEEARDDGPTFTTLYTNSTGVLRHGSIPTYTESSINNSRSITFEELLSGGFIKRYRLATNISLTPPPGARFISWDPNNNNYTSLPTDANYESDNLKSTIITMFYFGNDIYILNITPYSKTFIRAISNNGSDAAINYNTTNWQAVALSDPSSVLRISNRYPITLTTNTFTPGYTGFFNVSHNLHIRSTGPRCHLAARIINTTTNEVIIVTDYTYIRATNGHNLDTLKLGNLDIPCVSGESYQLQLIRQGTDSTSATLDNVNRSSITIKSVTF